ncbi:MAG TPA: Rab family GTPase [Thermoplasmata archaeon]|nr:Rab family GTPase [Thermoplasmata archaeon]
MASIVGGFSAGSRAQSMLEPRRMKVKVCLVGEHAVGKTSLIRRYVLNEYDDRYIVTLGAKVSKKELTFTPKGGTPVQMDMTIWDIMGSKGFRELLREAYFHGAQGILAVCDITRYDTLEDLDSWVESVFKTVGEIPVTFAVNKTDLRDQAAFGEEQVKQATEAFDAPFYYSSAKTGENVEFLFRGLGETIATAARPEA